MTMARSQEQLWGEVAIQWFSRVSYICGMRRSLHVCVRVQRVEEAGLPLAQMKLCSSIAAVAVAFSSSADLCAQWHMTGL